MAIEKMKEITQKEHKNGTRTFDFYYFPISLAQLSAADENRLPDPSNLYQRLQQIPTHYHVSEEESTLLAQHSILLMSSNLRGGVLMAKKRISGLGTRELNLLDWGKKARLGWPILVDPLSSHHKKRLSTPDS